MLHRLVIEQTEKETGSSAQYLSKLHGLSRRVFWRFVVAILCLRTKAPNVDARAVASVRAILLQDCGPCLEIAVRLAQAEGANIAVLRAVLADQPEELPENLRLVYQHAQAVDQHDSTVSELARQIEERFGPKVAADVALTLALAPVYPRLKRALGVATSHCVRPTSLVDPR